MILINNPPDYKTDISINFVAPIGCNTLPFWRLLGILDALTKECLIRC